MFQEITDDSLQQLIDSNDRVLVQYSAGWCGNCRIMKPKFKKMASENNSIPFVIIDAEKNPNSRKLADVSNLPTFASFRDGKLNDQIQTNKTELLKTFVHEATAN
ncbi:MAG: thiol reductase thioredoxin [Flavobacteriales bacterium]|nr:thiol reductase thioredoxin [Candidatus Arcticimaribacter sp.]|tara:strand:+ start:479 stop:793 length:315 start_codon:yes stop_codon:yes gene_type:complete